MYEQGRQGSNFANLHFPLLESPPNDFEDQITKVKRLKVHQTQIYPVEICNGKKGVQ